MERTRSRSPERNSTRYLEKEQQTPLTKRVFSHPPAEHLIFLVPHIPLYLASGTSSETLSLNIISVLICFLLDKANDEACPWMGRITEEEVGRFISGEDTKCRRCGKYKVSFPSSSFTPNIFPLYLLFPLHTMSICSLGDSTLVFCISPSIYISKATAISESPSKTHKAQKMCDDDSRSRIEQKKEKTGPLREAAGKEREERREEPEGERSAKFETQRSAQSAQYFLWIFNPIKLTPRKPSIVEPY